MFFLWSCNILGNQQRHGVATTARAHAIEVIKNNSSPLTLDCELAGENANFTWSTPSIVFALPCDNTVIVIRWTVLQWKIKRINWIETGFKFVIKQQKIQNKSEEKENVDSHELGSRSLPNLNYHFGIIQQQTEIP